MYNLFLIVGEAIPAYGSSDNYIAQDFDCNGTESTLQECDFTNATADCYGQHVAGFRCRQGELSLKFYILVFCCSISSFLCMLQNPLQFSVLALKAACDTGMSLTCTMKLTL